MFRVRGSPAGRNVIVGGPSGTGRAIFIEALGQQVVEAGMRDAWFRLEDFGILIRAHLHR